MSRMICLFVLFQKTITLKYRVQSCDIYQLKNTTQHLGGIGSSPKASPRSPMVRKLVGMRDVQYIHAMRTH